MRPLSGIDEQNRSRRRPLVAMTVLWLLAVVSAFLAVDAVADASVDGRFRALRGGVRLFSASHERENRFAHNRRGAPGPFERIDHACMPAETHEGLRRYEQHETFRSCSSCDLPGWLPNNRGETRAVCAAVVIPSSKVERLHPTRAPPPTAERMAAPTRSVRG